jgi:TPR repeat protein
VSSVSKTLAAAGRVDDAAECIHGAIQVNPTLSVHFRTQLAEIYDQSGRTHEAKAVLEDAADDGDPSAMREFGRYLLRSENADQIESGLGWLRRAARAGHPWAMYDLAEALRIAGRADEAREWLEQAAGFGNPNAIEELSSSLPHDQAADWIKALASTGDAFATTKLTEMLDEPEALSWLRAATEDGNTAAMETLIWTLKKAGNLTEADPWLRRATLMGLTAGVSDLAELLEQAQRPEEASLLRRYGIEPDRGTAEPWRSR